MAKRDQKTYVSYYGVEGARKVEMTLGFFIKPLVGTNHHSCWLRIRAKRDMYLEQEQNMFINGFGCLPSVVEWDCVRIGDGEGQG